MNNPFEAIGARLDAIESKLDDLKQSFQADANFQDDPKYNVPEASDYLVAERKLLVF